MPTLSRPERKRTEGDISDEIRARLSKFPEVTLWRNNCGMLEDRNGTPLRYGLAIGSADLIGMLTVNAPRDMARFLAIEVKVPGRKSTPEQAAWQDVVRKAGGLVDVCTSADEAEDLIARGMRWEQ